MRITAPADHAFLSGVVHILIETAADQAIDHVSVAAGGEALGMDSSSPYDVTWDTHVEADGLYMLVATAQSRDLHETVSLRISVTVDNTPPAVHWISPKDGQIVGGIVPLEASPSDLIGVQMVRFLVNGVAVGEVTAAPYLYHWQTQAAPNIPSALEARVFDRAGNSATSASVTVKVSNANRYPVLEPIAPHTLSRGETLSFTLKASDPDGARDPLTYGIVNGPAWLEVNPKTGDVRGIPPDTEVSRTQAPQDYAGVRFQVCDPELLCDTQETSISLVYVNHPPVLESPGDHTLEERRPLSITLVGRDPDGDPLTCKAMRLPKWAKFDPEACTLSGAPGPDVATLKHPKTVYDDVAFTMCDPNGLCAQQTIAITVLDVQKRPPVFDPIPSLKVDEGKPMTLTLRAVDPDEENVELVIAEDALPEGSAFAAGNDGTGRFTWTPRFDQAGTYTVPVAATDGALTATAQIVLAVREKSLAISGIVIDTHSKLPLKGAVVQISTVRGTVQEPTTDGHGLYLAKDLRPDAYEVRPRYDLKRAFSSAKAVKMGRVTFAPSLQRVTLSDHDQVGVDFTAVPP